MNVEITTKMLILIDSYKHFDLSRQTIKNSNTTPELLEVKAIKN